MLGRMFIAVFSFSLGVLVMDHTQEIRKEDSNKELAEKIRKCSGYWVTRPDLTQDCRSLMPVVFMKEPVPLRRNTN